MLPEAAARAGWTLDRTNGLYEAVLQRRLHRRTRAGRPAHRNDRRHQHDVGDLSTFALSIVAVSRYGWKAPGRPPSKSGPTAVWSGMVDGLRFVWDLKVLRTLALIVLAMTGLYLPMESVLFPKYFIDRSEPAHLGWVLMALSVGGLVGALAYPLLVRQMNGRVILLIATLTLGVCTAAISVCRRWRSFCCCAPWSGWCTGRSHRSTTT